MLYNDIFDIHLDFASAEGHGVITMIIGWGEGLDQILFILLFLLLFYYCLSCCNLLYFPFYCLSCLFSFYNLSPLWYFPLWYFPLFPFVFINRWALRFYLSICPSVYLSVCLFYRWPLRFYLSNKGYTA